MLIFPNGLCISGPVHHGWPTTHVADWFLGCDFALRRRLCFGAWRPFNDNVSTYDGRKPRRPHIGNYSLTRDARGQWLFPGRIIFPNTSLTERDIQYLYTVYIFTLFWDACVNNLYLGHSFRTHNGAVQVVWRQAFRSARQTERDQLEMWVIYDCSLLTKHSNNSTLLWISVGRLEAVSWRVDYTLSSSEMKVVNEGVIQLKLQASGAESGSSQTTVVSLSADKFRVLLSGLSRNKSQIIWQPIIS